MTYKTEKVNVRDTTKNSITCTACNYYKKSVLARSAARWAWIQ